LIEKNGRGYIRKRVGDHALDKPFGGYEVLNEEDSLYSIASIESLL
jgi:hypothetical protein